MDSIDIDNTMLVHHPYRFSCCCSSSSGRRGEILLAGAGAGAAALNDVGCLQQRSSFAIIHIHTIRAVRYSIVIAKSLVVVVVFVVLVIDIVIIIGCSSCLLLFLAADLD